MPIDPDDADSWLDAVLADSFPASDPFSPHQIRAADRRRHSAPEPREGGPPEDP